MGKIFKWIGIGVVALIVFAGIGSALGGNGGDSTSAGETNDNAATTAPASDASSAPSTPKPKPKPSLTLAQQSAIQAANSYLNLGTGFSRAGLIDQLSSKVGSGFPVATATFAVDHLKIDWNKQAVTAAKNYLSLGTGFSRSGLITQLSSKAGSKFTVAQATYAANKVGF